MGERNWILTMTFFGESTNNRVNFLGNANIPMGSEWDLDSAVAEAMEELGIVEVEVNKINMRMIHDKDPSEPHHYKPA